MTGRPARSRLAQVFQDATGRDLSQFGHPGRHPEATLAHRRRRRHPVAGCRPRPAPQGRRHPRPLALYDPDGTRPARDPVLDGTEATLVRQASAPRDPLAPSSTRSTAWRGDEGSIPPSARWPSRTALRGRPRPGHGRRGARPRPHRDPRRPPRHVQTAMAGALAPRSRSSTTASIPARLQSRRRTGRRAIPAQHLPGLLSRIEGPDRARAQYDAAGNMTDQIAAFTTLLDLGDPDIVDPSSTSGRTTAS
jgi:hypothetical protein